MILAPETFRSLLCDRAHWEFELFLMLLFDGLILGLLWPFVRVHWRHHVDRDNRDARPYFHTPQLRSIDPGYVPVSFKWSMHAMKDGKPIGEPIPFLNDVWKWGWEKYVGDAPPDLCEHNASKPVKPFASDPPFTTIGNSDLLDSFIYSRRQS